MRARAATHNYRVAVELYDLARGARILLIFSRHTCARVLAEPGE